MPEEERRNHLGALIPDVEEAAEAQFTENPAAAAPAALDWRSNKGDNYVTPIRYQGNCGDCWAFATTAALESQVLITTNAPGTNIDLSEQILVSCSGAGSCSGGYPSSASNYIQTVGLPVESCFPYTATDASCATCLY